MEVRERKKRMHFRDSTMKNYILWNLEVWKHTSYKGNLVILVKPEQAIRSRRRQHQFEFFKVQLHMFPALVKEAGVATLTSQYLEPAIFWID